MHTGAFAAAGQRLADTDDSFSSAPRGILIGQIAQILRDAYAVRDYVQRKRVEGPAYGVISRAISNGKRFTFY